MPPKDKYTDPKLRDEVKEEIQEGDKGGAPGQWSARKAQMMASEYKKRGGDYNTDKSDKDESQKNLDKWGSEDWQTKEGSGSAKREDGSEKRYLPKKAWEKMSEEEKQATEDAKREGDEEGKQHVGNTQTAKEKRKEAGEEVEAEEDDGKKDEDEDSGKKNGSAKKSGDDEEKTGKDEDESGKSGKADTKSSSSSAKKDKPKSEPTRRSTRNKDKQEQDDTSTGEKRKDTSSSSKSSSPSAKKQKTNDNNGSTSHAVDGKSTYGSKHESTSAPHPPASADRLPKPGQKVTWKAMPGWVEGSVIEVVTSDKTVEGGKHVKASEKDPRIVLRSHGPSGKVAVHKPEAVFFE